MIKVIKLNRFVFEKGVIQHNVIVRTATIFGNQEEMLRARIECLEKLIENLSPAVIIIKSLEPGTRLLTKAERIAKCFSLANRNVSFYEGEEIKLEQFSVLVIFCYLECLELELDVLDIKDKHITVCANIGNHSDHYLFGPPESVNNEYIERCKKDLPGWPISGSFNKTL